ncbi:hypothetical protein ACO3VM_09490 (plasmid) [Methanocaldococcus sp. 10A]
MDWESKEAWDKIRTVSLMIAKMQRKKQYQVILEALELYIKQMKEKDRQKVDTIVNILEK